MKTQIDVQAAQDAAKRAFAGEVRRRRLAAGLTFVQLHQLTGLSTRTLSGLEQEDPRYGPSLMTIVSLAAAFGCEPWELIKP